MEKYVGTHINPGMKTDVYNACTPTLRWEADRNASHQAWWHKKWTAKCPHFKWDWKQGVFQPPHDINAQTLIHPLYTQEKNKNCIIVWTCEIKWLRNNVF